MMKHKVQTLLTLSPLGHIAQHADNNTTYELSTMAHKNIGEDEIEITTDNMTDKSDAKTQPKDNLSIKETLFQDQEPPKDDHHQQQQLQSQSSLEVEAKQLERYNAEVNAAMRSLKTNITLSIVFFIVFILISFLSETAKIFVVSGLKGFAPVLSTMANFGKIQQVFLLYWKNFTQIIIKCKAYFITSAS